MIVPSVVRQHADEAVFLATTRLALTGAPHVTLSDLRRFDNRLAAHLDGLRVAGEHAWPFCDPALGFASAGAAFTAAVRAIEEVDAPRLDSILALTEARPGVQRGLLSAFGWLEPGALHGLVAGLLGGLPDPFRRMVGLAACAMHRVDPGVAGWRSLQDVSPHVRARALRTIGEIGRRELVSSCAAAIGDDDEECHFWAAWSAVLLGDRNRGLDVLTERGLSPRAHRGRSIRLALQAMSMSAAHRILQQLARDPQQVPWLIQGSGIAGDPAYVPWLMTLMSAPDTARLAGEAFTLIVGVDPRLEARARPAVDRDPDDGLPRPDLQGVQRWWEANKSRFQPGQRYLAGAPLTHEHCIDVLKSGYQHQRILAAQYLCLLDPGTPLFNTSAPAWRQQRLLACMT